MAGYLFVERASDDQVKDLKSAIDLLSAALSTGGVPDRIYETVHFFDVLLDGSGNLLLRKAISMLHDRIVLLRASSISSAQRGLRSLSEMQAIVDAISARDADAAKDACIAHVHGARDAALAA